MKLIIKEIKSKDILLIITSVLLIIFQVWLDLKIPDYMSTITRLVQSNITEITPVIKNGAYMLLCAGGSLISGGVSLLGGAAGSPQRPAPRRQRHPQRPHRRGTPGDHGVSPGAGVQPGVHGLGAAGLRPGGP